MTKQQCRKIEVIPLCKSGHTYLGYSAGRGDIWEGRRSIIFWRSVSSQILESLSVTEVLSELSGMAAFPWEPAVLSCFLQAMKSLMPLNR